MQHEPIGEICVQLGLLTPEGVARVLETMGSAEGQRFGEVATTLGLLDDEGMARALAVQFHLNLVPGDRLARIVIAPDVLDRVPASLMRERLLVPGLYEPEHGVLTVLAADPTDAVGFRTLKAAAGVARLRVFLAPKGALRRLVARILPPERPRLVHDEVPGVARPPTTPPRILLEPDQTLAAALKRVAIIERSGVEVVSDPTLLAPTLQATGPTWVYHRRAAAPFVARHLDGWRARWPGLPVCEVPGWTRRHGVPYEAGRDFLFSALHAALAAVEDATRSADERRYVRLVRTLARALALPPEAAEAVELVALLAGLDGADPSHPRWDRPERAWALRAAVPSPWRLTPLLDGLTRRAAGADQAGSDLGVEILYTARAFVRAGHPDGIDPIDAFGADAIRHDGQVLLALHEVSRAAGLRARIAKAGSSGAAVLLAVSDPVERVALEGRLADAGFEPISAADAPSALALARARPPQAALVDQRLAPRDGLALLTDLARDRVTRSVPTLLLLDRDQPRAVTRAFEHGAIDVVERPIDLADATLRLRRAMDRHASDATPFAGRLEEIDLHSLVRLMGDAYVSGRILVHAPRAHGEIHVREGQVERCWLAELAEATPVDAPLEIFGSVAEGSFEIRFGEGALLPRPGVVQRPPPTAP